MKFFLTLIAMVLLVTPAIADNHGGGEAGGMPPMGKPAEMSKLDFFHGDWDVTVQYKMDPAGDWLTSSGTASSKPVLNGCANQMHFSSEMMGMPFSGVDHTVFDRETGKFQSIWVDDMSARFTILTGGFEGDEIVMTGKGLQMGNEYLMKTVAKKASDTEVHWSMFMSFDNGANWMEGMKMVYTRK